MWVWVTAMCTSPRKAYDFSVKSFASEVLQRELGVVPFQSLGRGVARVQLQGFNGPTEPAKLLLHWFSGAESITTLGEKVCTSWG